MPVQRVELEPRELIDETPDERDRLEVTRGIEHRAAPRETRLIGDVELRDLDARDFFDVLRQQLPERDAAVEKPARIARDQQHAMRIDCEIVAFARRHVRGARVEAEHNCITRLVAAKRAHVEMDTARFGEQIGEAARDVCAFGVLRVDDERGAVAQLERAALVLDERRLRDQRERELVDRVRECRRFCARRRLRCCRTFRLSRNARGAADEERRDCRDGHE